MDWTLDWNVFFIKFMSGTKLLLKQLKGMRLIELVI
jgi:hypothetical protein